MNSISSHTISNKQFLILSVNLLAKTLLDAPRTEAKRCYTELLDAKRVALSRVQMDDESILDVFLNMDCTEYCGQVNFSHFREQVRLLLQRLATALDNNEKIDVLTDANAHTSVFNMPILHSKNEQTNALAFAWSVGATGELDLKLMYLDPEQFKVSPDAKKQAQLEQK